MGASGCCRGIRCLGGVTGKPKNSFISRSTAALALIRLLRAILLLSRLRSRSGMGLMLLMARCASIDAVRRCLELWRRWGVPTINAPRRPGNKKPAGKNEQLK